MQQIHLIICIPHFQSQHKIYKRAASVVRKAASLGLGKLGLRLLSRAGIVGLGLSLGIQGYNLLTNNGKLIPGGGPPPKSGPNPQGLNVPGKKIIVVKNSEKKNVNNRQSSTKRSRDKRNNA